MNGKRRFIPAAWGVIVFASLLLLGFRLAGGVSLETSVLELLPGAEDEIGRSFDVLSKEIGRKIVLLVGHRDRQTALLLADQFSCTLENSGQFRNVLYRHTGFERSWRELYFPYRYQILSESARRMLGQAGGLNDLLAETQALLYSPLAALAGGVLTDDPLLLHYRFLRELPLPAIHARLHDDVLTFEGSGLTYALIAADTKGDAFSPAVQRAAIGAIAHAEELLHQSAPQAEILYSGLIRFADHSARSMAGEAALLGWGSLVGVLVFLLWAFGSWRYVALSVLSVVVGLMQAFVFSILIFSKLHIIVIAFGSSLVGVCIDYSIHFLVQHRCAAKGWDGWTAQRRILPALSLGAATSLLGFAGLGLTHLPGLQQIAFFSSVGLIGSYCTVMCWFPVLLKESGVARRSVLSRAAEFFLIVWERRAGRPALFAGAVLCLFISAGGLFRLRVNDDIRLLQQAPRELVDNDRRVSSLIGGYERHRFMLVHGSSEEQLLRRLEDLCERLEPLHQRSAFDGFQALSLYVPSLSRQRENKALLAKAAAAHRGELNVYFDELGFRPEGGKLFMQEVNKPVSEYLTVDGWLSAEASQPLRHLWVVPDGGRFASFVFFENIRDEAALQQLAAGADGWLYVNKVQDLSLLLGRYRRESVRLVLLSYALVYCFLLWRYGMYRGSIICLPPVLAALVGLALLGLIHGTINLFNVIALVVVLGVGIDYPIFFAEERKEKGITMLAILICASTTIMSFGMLVLSRTPLLHSFGLTIGCGVALAFLFSPIAARFARQSCDVGKETES